MKFILGMLLISTLATQASTNIIKRITHPPTPENLRLKTIESQLGISRTDWKYNIKENEQLEVVWHKEGAEDVYKWIIDSASNPSHILALIIIRDSDYEDSILQPKIEFGPDNGGVTTSFLVKIIAGELESSLTCEELNKLTLEEKPIRLWSLKTNNGSGLEPCFHATVQLKKKSDQPSSLL